MSAAGGEKRKTLEKWAFRGVPKYGGISAEKLRYFAE